MNKEDLVPFLKQRLQEGKVKFNIDVQVLIDMIENMDLMKDIIEKQNRMLELSAGVRVSPLNQQK